MIVSPLYKLRVVMYMSRLVDREMEDISLKPTREFRRKNEDIESHKYISYGFWKKSER